VRHLAGPVAWHGLVLLIALTLNFLLPRLMPGSPLRFLAGEDAALLSDQERARVLREAGLDRPLGAQYAGYLVQIARGDLGRSFQHRRPVADLVRERLPWTLLLTGTALVLATAAGVGLGAAAAWRRGTRLDRTALGATMGLQAMPAFWLGMVLVAVFAVELRLLPSFGAREIAASRHGLDALLDVARHLALPVATLTLATVPPIFLATRAGLVLVLGADFIRVARAKGLSERAILWRHGLRNAALPVATVFMLTLGQAVAGATVVETVFSYPGVGRLMYEAALARDYPLLQGGFLILTVTVLAANVATDAGYRWLDPRVRGDA
jgi:peptide/nickel transport system permease protein